MGRSLAAFALLAALLLPAVPAQEPAARVVVNDPQGDAREWTSEVAASAACGRLPSGTCAGAPAGAGGTPAPPDRDILSVAFEDTPEDLLVTLTVASLADRAMSAAPLNGWVGYFVCWTTGSEECLLAFTYDRGDGASLETEFAFESPACGATRECDWGVEAWRTVGTPGSITWRVPRFLLPNGSAGTTFDNVAASTTLTPKAANGVRAVALEQPRVGFENFGFVHTNDVTEVGTYTLVTRAAPADWSRVPRGPMPDNRGDVLGEPMEELDVLASAFVETPTTLTYALQFAVVKEASPPIVLFGSLDMPAGEYDLDLTVVNGERTPSAGTCLDRDDAGACVRYVTVPVTLDVAVGAPGWLNFTLSRGDLGHPAAGEVVSRVIAEIYVVDERAPAGDAMSTRVEAYTSEDWASPLPAFRFEHDTALPVDEDDTVTVIEDPQGDVVRPAQVLNPAEERRYDILAVLVSPSSPTETRLTLAVQDLSRVSVPTSFDAVMYGVAVETAGGSFMAAYLKDRNGQQAFFCATDVTVLAPNKADPREVVWTPILGVLTTGAAGGARGEGGGAGASSSITFFVPHTCFGVERPGPIEARRLAAGTYLVPAAGGSGPHALDEARSDAPVTLGEPVVVAAPLPWYEENLLDAVGIGAAVLTSAAGVGVVAHRRRVLRRYLAEVDAIDREDADDPARKAQRLKALRSRIKEDVVRGRLSEGHFVVVERRIDEELSQARVDAMAETLARIERRLGGG